jgi:hypothetical protein
MADMPGYTRYLPKGGSKTFGASFEKEGAVKAGETLSNPDVILSAGSGVVFVGKIVNPTDFVDSENGDPIPAGKGVIARFDATNAVPGIYKVEWRANSSGGDKLRVIGKLIITDPVV